MNEPLVSVIVPVYKVEDYLDKCVESIVEQTYKNLEIILVDDGSPDNCPSMCDSWAQKDSRIKVIHKENGGVSSARNSALDTAAGDYICFVDSDDFIEPNAVGYMLENIGDADVIQCSFSYDYLDGRTENCDISEEEFCADDAARALITDRVCPEVWGKLYSAHLFSGIRFDGSKKYGEDLYINYFLMKRAEKLISRNVCLYHYMCRESDSATSHYMTDSRARLYKITGAMAENEKDSPLYEACVYRHTRILFATPSRIILGEKEFYDKYFNVIVKEILAYRRDILKNKRLRLKFKISVLMLSLSPKLYARVYGIALKRKGGE